MECYDGVCRPSDSRAATEDLHPPFGELIDAAGHRYVSNYLTGFSHTFPVPHNRSTNLLHVRTILANKSADNDRHTVPIAAPSGVALQLLEDDSQTRLDHILHGSVAPCEAPNTQGPKTASLSTEADPESESVVCTGVIMTVDSQSTAVTPRTSTPSRTSACSVLQAFQSMENVTSPTPALHTPNTVRSLYASVKSRQQLERLDMSSLISLFGSLSLPSECYSPSVGYVHPLASPMQRRAATSRTYWPFVLQIVKDKRRLGQYLSIKDRYWAMRAELANAHTATCRSEPF
jgi:hypothetical protein